MAAFGFSVGDFIAGIHLTKSILTSLRASGGSISHLSRLDTSIHSLQRTIKRTKQSYSTGISPQISDEHTERIVADVVEAFEACGRAIEGFERGTEGYRESFERVGKSGEGVFTKGKNKARKTWNVVKFPREIGDILEEFEFELDNAVKGYNFHVNRLDQYLACKAVTECKSISTFQTSEASVARSRHLALEEKLDKSYTIQSEEARLASQRHYILADRLAEGNAQTSDLSGQLQTILELCTSLAEQSGPRASPRSEQIMHSKSFQDRVLSESERVLGVLKEKGSIYVVLPLAVLAVVFCRILTEALLALSGLPLLLGLPWETKEGYRNSILLLDAIGRELRIPIELATTLGQFQKVIEISFEKHAVYQRIVDKKYSIFDSNHRGHILSTRGFQTEEEWAMRSRFSCLQMSVELELDFAFRGGAFYYKCPECDPFTDNEVLVFKAVSPDEASYFTCMRCGAMVRMSGLSIVDLFCLISNVRRIREQIEKRIRTLHR